MWNVAGVVVALVVPFGLGVAFYLAARDPSRSWVTRQLINLYRPIYPKDPQGALLAISITMFATWMMIVISFLFEVSSPFFWTLLIGSLIVSLAIAHRRWFS